MMRFFYVVLKLALQYSVRIFYPRFKTVNAPRQWYGRTIYVSNHAAAFMDPLVAAGMRRPIVFFMTRSDVFTPITRPILWTAHMLPIYRQHDGVDTKDKNAAVFDQCARILSFGRNLLIFGEGFTDDVFIRRLKPLKKGAVRIGFHTLEKINWKKKIYIAAVGVNYSDPNEMRSDCLVSTSKKICLNDYKELYLENPNKAITELTKIVEDLLKTQITHVEDKQWSEFHEEVMMLTRKGMNALHSDHSVPLEKRWHYSQKLALWLNEKTSEELDNLIPLKEKVADYFSELKKNKIDENHIHEMAVTGKINRTTNLMHLALLFPFMLFGMVHCAIPYLLVKRFVEKSFKRRVFWGSVKLLMGMIAIGLLNIPVIFVIYAFVYPSYLIAIGYYLLIGFFGLAAYMWFRHLKRFQQKDIAQQKDLTDWVARRAALIKEVQTEIPVA
jgi:1-acyl-sn-glycerol-3-phosphate acyltransferase